MGAGSINGIVTDIGTGARIMGAMVSGGGQTTTNDAQGQFTLSGLATGAVSLSISKTGYAPGFANGKAGDHPDAVVAWLKKQGEMQPYNPGTAITLSQKTEAGPYAVIFQPGSLNSTDPNLMVSITPLDPTKERQALPGNLVTAGTTATPLIPVTFAEFTILDSHGARVNLKPSASAIVELPIPPALRASYPLGTTIHCYSYDATTGAWEDFVGGTVQTSSVDGTSPVLAAQVRHFSWYGGAPEGNNCVNVPVKVVSAVDGRPLGNARVEASPGTVSYTDADGNATITTVAMGVTSYTAYQTGFDIDGSLTGMPGAKYIEFGQVQEQAMGTQVSCRGPSRTEAGAAGTTPVTIKIGVVKNLLYSATAILSASDGGSSAGVFVMLQFGVPGPTGALANPMPASGAIITLSGGGTTSTLTELAPGTGLYGLSASTSVAAGAAYLLQIDGDGNGSIDGAGTVFAVGNLAWTNPTEGANVAASGLTATWTDSAAAGNPAYAPIYEVVISSTSTQDGAFYIGTAPRFPVTTAFASGGPLSPGSYTATLTGFSGFSPTSGGGIQLSNNITGAGVTGTFFSAAAAPAEVNFTVH
jgi:hypothetical protein